MATTTEVKEKAAEAAAKKTVVPKEMREALIRGDGPKLETPEQKLKRETDEKAAKDKSDREAKGKLDRESKEADEKEKKKKKADLPPIPPVAPPAGVTEERVKEIVAGAKPAAETVVPPKLGPDDQKDLELAEFAARQHPGKYAELPKKLTEWVGKRDEFLAAKAKELGGRESAEFRDFVKGDEFGKFVRDNAPTYQRGDGTKIHEEFIEERGAQRALNKIKPELDEVKRRQLQIEQQPIIDRTVGEGVKMMLTDNDVAPDEALTEFGKSAPDFMKSNEIEGGIIVRHATFFKEAMQETMRITSGLVDSKELENPTPTQKWIDQFILQKEAEIESKYPNGAPVHDGTIIVSGAQLARLRAAKAPNLAAYRMMLPGEIVGAMAVEGRAEIKRQLASERQKLERSGFQRVKKVEVKPEGEKLAPSGAEGSPIAGAAPARGAGGAPEGGGAQEPYWKRYVTGKAS